MDRITPERRAESNKRGTKAEKDFEKAAEEVGYFIFYTKGNQDFEEHWDRKLVKDSTAEYVDVKSMKDVHDAGFTWLETQNIHGKKGWITSDDLDWRRAIAFEMEDRFDMIDVVDLRRLITEKVDFTKPLLENRVDDLEYMKYRQYRRYGNDDRLILTPYSDLQPLIYKTIYKV